MLTTQTLINIWKIFSMIFEGMVIYFFIQSCQASTHVFYFARYLLTLTFTWRYTLLPIVPRTSLSCAYVFSCLSTRPFFWDICPNKTKRKKNQKKKNKKGPVQWIWMMQNYIRQAYCKENQLKSFSIKNRWPVPNDLRICRIRKPKKSK